LSVSLVGQAVAAKSTKRVFECMRLVAKAGELEIWHRLETQRGGAPKLGGFAARRLQADVAL